MAEKIAPSPLERALVVVAAVTYNLSRPPKGLTYQEYMAWPGVALHDHVNEEICLLQLERCRLDHELRSNPSTAESIE